MPEAVADWVENKDVTKINEIQAEILSNYRKDFIKHTDNTTAVRIRQVFDSLPAQFAKKNDKFLYGTVKEGARAREVDIGLFRYLAEIPFAVIANKTAIFDEFNGLVAEQFVLQQLVKHTLYFWIGGEESEVDFVMQYDSEIVPIEVKNGKNVKAKSLKIFREKYTPKVSIRFSLKNTQLDNDILNISLFNSFLCENLLDYSSEKCVK
jgi:hypothetical protein